MKHFSSILTGIIISLTMYQSFAQKIYQWRGENREGKYNESQVLQKWPEKGPELLWYTEEIGSGYAAPVVADNEVLINGETNGNSYLFAFDIKGKLLWKSPNGKEFIGEGYSAQFPGARATPTVVDDLVYTISGLGRLACFELKTGKEKWAVDLVTDLGGLLNYYGYSESPLIDGDTIYCMPGGPINNVAALNRFTGKTVWTSKAIGDTTSFCSPIIINLPARKVLVTLSHHYIFGVDTKNGELLWSKEFDKSKYDDEHCNTPVFSNGFIYYTLSEDSVGTIKLELSPDGKSIKEIWRNTSSKNFMGGLILLDNYLFETTTQKKLVCLDTETGNVIDSLQATGGSLIYCNKLFYCYNTNGNVKLVKFENNKFSEISKFKIDKGSQEHLSHPVIASGILYIRHGKALLAYKIN